MARRYDPVLGRWIYGLPDDAPEPGPVRDEPITLHFDGWIGAQEWEEALRRGEQDQRIRDQLRNNYWTQPSQERCRICWADPGECTHTGWDGRRSTIVDDVIRIPPAERAGPAMIGDGVLRGEVTGIGWPKVLERLAAIDDGLLQLAKLHAPSVEMNSRGKLTYPECQGCFDTSGCHEEWPCESATILLRRIELTERDLDYQLGDADDGEGAGPL